MRAVGHFIGGKEVKGTSGRTADVFEPMTGDVQAKVALRPRPRSAPPSRTPAQHSPNGLRPTRSGAPAS